MIILIKILMRTFFFCIVLDEIMRFIYVYGVIKKNNNFFLTFKIVESFSAYHPFKIFFWTEFWPQLIKTEELTCIIVSFYLVKSFFFNWLPFFYRLLSFRKSLTPYPKIIFVFFSEKFLVKKLLLKISRALIASLQ